MAWWVQIDTGMKLRGYSWASVVSLTLMSLSLAYANEDMKPVCEGTAGLAKCDHLIDLKVPFDTLGRPEQVLPALEKYMNDKEAFWGTFYVVPGDSIKEQPMVDADAQYPRIAYEFDAYLMTHTFGLALAKKEIFSCSKDPKANLKGYRLYFLNKGSSKIVGSAADGFLIEVCPRVSNQAVTLDGHVWVKKGVGGFAVNEMGKYLKDAVDSLQERLQEYMKDGTTRLKLMRKFPQESAALDPNRAVLSMTSQCENCDEAKENGLLMKPVSVSEGNEYQVVPSLGPAIRIR